MKPHEGTSPSTVLTKIETVSLALIAFTGICDIIRHILLGAWIPVATMILIQAMLLLICFLAKKSHQPWWMVLACAGASVLFFFMNNPATTLFNAGLLVTAVISGIWALAGTLLVVLKKGRPGKLSVKLLLAPVIIVLVFLGYWGISFLAANHRSGPAGREIWGVPKQWDTPASAPEGTVEEVFYPTRAYATDGREVTKSCLVYLPAGYEESESYDILYLMHGTGNDQYTWLQTHPYNKTMLDNLIAAGEIRPLIVVTPTFYTEDDCTESVAALEGLTYAFKDELRNDLMPFIESRYSTYAETPDEDGFTDSRSHRAFAGLSRGAVTTYRSVLCGCLDYFSTFGTFSGSRTGAEYFKEHLQSKELASYPIDYLYVSTGNFDFAMPQQLKDYHALLKIEPRLTPGENTCFDIFPMRYHSMGDWHLALYNFLQKIF